MSRSSRGQIPGEGERAVALQYSPAMLSVLIGAVLNIVLDPIFIFVLGMGVQGAALATVLSQMELGREIPEELYQAIVEIYVYFLNFDPKDPEKFRRERNKQTGPAAGGEKT